MEAVTFIIALVALVLAVIAFLRTRGIGNLRQQFDTLSSKTETAREKTADALDRLEQVIRGKGKPPEAGKGSHGSSTPDERE